MATFFVNGKTVALEKNQKLLTFLRESLDLTSVKNGCFEGACGTCMVLIDGKAVKACVQQTDRLEGKNVVTVEGLSKRERDVYAYAFTEAGAVQCGFCTPGMVISAKGLIDSVPDPSPDEVKKAIRNNICRCTGYKKIEEAILLAAKMLRENIPVPCKETTGALGENMHRVDAVKKILGEAVYADDIRIDGMIFGSALRSKYPRARVVSIDTSAAKNVPGVVAVLTADDVPGSKKIGHIRHDWDVLIPIGKITHYLGDAVALVAAENTDALEEAKSLIKVEYEELPPVTDPKMALREDAPRVHEEWSNVMSKENLVRGFADDKIKQSKYVVTNHYSTPFTEHAFLEPECAVALMEGDAVRVYSADQGVYQTQREVALMLGLEPGKVRVTGCAIGGGFGGKEDMSVQHHAALLAYITKRPVKVRLTRAESILVHSKRHAMEIDITTACDENGYLTAMKAVIVADTGAYASLGGPVLQRACTHAAGPYNYQDIDILGMAVYTNNPPAGAFRGFGVPQSCFAMECNLNLLAEKAGISAWEIRRRNAIMPGQVLPNGQIADDSTALLETLEAVKPDYDKNPKMGIACAMKNSGLGVGIPDTGRCKLVVEKGKVHIRSSASCIGQGVGTVLMQMVCETTGLAPSNFVYDAPDTFLTPDAGNTTASRQTLFTGEAAVRASKLFMEALGREGSIKALEGREFLGEYTGITDKMGADVPNPVSHIAYSYATHCVELDGEGRLKRVISAHDIGRTVNPKMLEGQMEGGAVMSLGYALTEDYPLENCMPKAKFGTLGLFKSTDVPVIETRIIQKSKEPLAYGAKGIGEISSIPTPPAVQNAYYNYDGIFRTKLPLCDTPYRK
ncbi:MAG: putative xanthine dehydrogenase subunit D [Firmicutes bacterium ADurb.Bin182]|nr:MAG: putative xanthine dehydrogenase subunit D [Firmicutes bacterium ADurb.Bin182]